MLDSMMMKLSIELRIYWNLYFMNLSCLASVVDLPHDFKNSMLYRDFISTSMCVHIEARTRHFCLSACQEIGISNIEN